MAKVRLSPVHQALKNLLKDLNAAELSKLHRPEVLGEKLRVEDWVGALEKAATELETWCAPNSVGEPFTIDVEPRN
jgi:hypothetical protein